MTAAESALAHAERSPETTRERHVTWQDPVPIAAAGAELSGHGVPRGDLLGRDPAAADGACSCACTRSRSSRGERSSRASPGEEHYNPIGTVHGGYASTLLDSALGCAVHTTLPAGVGYTTLTLEVKMVRPITRDIERVRAEAEVLHRGRTQATAQARLIDAATGKLLATGTSTCLILERAASRRGRAARPRPAAAPRTRSRPCRRTRARCPRRCRRCRGGPTACRRRTPRGTSRRRSSPPCASPPR